MRSKRVRVSGKVRIGTRKQSANDMAPGLA